MQKTRIRIIYAAIFLITVMAVYSFQTLLIKPIPATIPASTNALSPVKSATTISPPTTITKNEIPTTLPEPVWQAHDENFSPSSPRLMDITGDNIKDIIMGDIQNDGVSVVTAINGQTGKELWRVAGYKDIFTSAAFLNIDDDGIPDIVMGGRAVDLLAISGLTGKLLWQFKKPAELELWGNFYSSLVISDQNNDGVQDLVTANGGDESRYINRPPGLFLIISGKTGEVLHKLPSPDGKETYMSPILAASSIPENPFILFGSGGETFPGSIWKISLSDLAAENAAGFRKILSSKTKGYEAPPASADFTADGIADYVIQGFDGTVSLVDGKTDSVLWEVTNEGFESIASPTLGFFTGNDTTPDIFLQLNRGIYPDYNACMNMLIDGKSGQVKWSSLFGQSSTSGSVAIDLNNDGVDEIIFAVNEPHAADGILVARFYAFDTTNKTLALWNKTNRYSIGAAWAGDLDNNGFIDIIMEGQTDNESKTPTLNRYELKNKAPAIISWGAYMGSDFNGNLKLKQ